MITIDLYGPSFDPRKSTPDFVLPITTEEQDEWSGRVAPLPPLAAADGTAFLDDYRAIMDGHDEQNARSDAYWYGAFGSRNTQNSSFYQGLEQLWRLDRQCDKALAANRSFGLVVPSVHMQKPVEDLARARGVGIRRRDGFAGRRRLDALRRPWGALRYLLILCDYGRMHGDYGPASNDVIFLTVSSDNLLRADRTDRDFIFGKFLSEVQDAGLRVLIMTQITGTIQPAGGRARHLAAPPIRTFVDMARPRDVAKAILGAATWRPVSSKAQSRLGISVAPLVMHDLRISRWRDLPTAFLLHGVLKRLSDRNPAAVFAHPFENNGWEHACQAAARSGGRKTVGFQHNALIPASEKTYASRRRPQPTRIVATGTAAKNALCNVFGYSASRIDVGYAMRQSGAYRQARKTHRPLAGDRIVVLLQGTAASMALLNILSDAFPETATCTVTLRPHPAIPLDRQLAKSAIGTLRRPFRASDRSDLYADLLDHDIAMSAGSTAGWEAVALGVPTIHVDIGSAASNNPMFAETALCRTARNSEEIHRALSEIVSLSDAAFEVETMRARRYFESYFARKTTDAFNRVVAALKPQAAS